MKVAVIIVRVLMGVLFLVSVIGFFFKLMPEPELSGNALRFVLGLDASGYLLPFVKVIELLCAVAFLSGRFMPLALVVIFPISLNILLFHGFLAPEGMIIPLFLFIGNLFLAYVYRKNYEQLVIAK